MCESGVLNVGMYVKILRLKAIVSVESSEDMNFLKEYLGILVPDQRSAIFHELLLMSCYMCK